MLTDIVRNKRHKDKPPDRAEVRTDGNAGLHLISKQLFEGSGKPDVSGDARRCWKHGRAMN